MPIVEGALMSNLLKNTGKTGGVLGKTAGGLTYQGVTSGNTQSGGNTPPWGNLKLPAITGNNNNNAINQPTGAHSKPSGIAYDGGGKVDPAMTMSNLANLGMGTARAAAGDLSGLLQAGPAVSNLVSMMFGSKRRRSDFSPPPIYETAQAEAARTRKNFLTGTAYQTQAQMIKNPTAQRNLLRMGGPRAVTQSRLLADQAIKNRALNNLVLQSKQLEAQQQQLADNYGIMSGKTRLDLELLADTQRRAQLARDKQALNANLGLLAYSQKDEEGEEKNPLMKQMMLARMLNKT